jgi:hypothetical protein
MGNVAKENKIWQNYELTEKLNNSIPCSLLLGG